MALLLCVLSALNVVLIVIQGLSFHFCETVLLRSTNMNVGAQGNQRRVVC